MEKIKELNTCKVCGKSIRKENKSRLCSHHYKMRYWNRKRKERKKKHLCIMCGSKVEQITRYYAYNIRPPVKVYPVRCAKCTAKEKISQKEYYKKKGRKEKQRLYHQIPEVKERLRKYAQRPYVKERGRLYRQRPEVKEKKKIYQREKRKKAKLIQNK